MAEFSKQWISINEGINGAWDFDIEEVASTIKNEHYVQLVCEGFGFVAVGKNDIGEIILAYRDFETGSDEIQWKHLNDIINEEIDRHGK